MLGPFFTGINYWGSKDAIWMWERFDVESIERDMELMKQYGVSHLRVFPLWSYFQPLRAMSVPGGIFEYRLGEVALPDTEAGRAGVSEEACERFGVFCDLAQKHGLNLTVALITGHMSFRNFIPEAFTNLNCITDPAVVKWQIKFAKYFVKRFREKPAIRYWDLGNETNNLGGTEDQFYCWCSAISGAIQTADPTRPVVSGVDSQMALSKFHLLPSVRDYCHIHTVHPYQIFDHPTEPLPSMVPILNVVCQSRLGEDVSGIPTFPQEFGSIGYTNCSQKTEADFYRGVLLAALAHDCHGIMWWCAFDQGQFMDAPYDFNDIGSDYGFFDRIGSPKPIALESRRLQGLLQALPEGKLPQYKREAVVLLPRDVGKSDHNTALAATILAKQANFDVQYCYLPDMPIPDAALYLFPSINHSKAISRRRLNELLEKVKKGAVLYISLDQALLRDIPEMTGVNIAFREAVSGVRNLVLDHQILPINCRVNYTIESVESEILARDQDGTPVFFRNRFGAGSIFFLTMPLEKSCMERPGVFHREERIGYEAVYRILAKEAGIKRLVDSDSPFIRITEHWCNDHEAYVFLINYSYRTETAAINFSKPCKVERVWGSAPENGKISLRGNDGTLLKVAFI